MAGRAILAALALTTLAIEAEAGQIMGLAGKVHAVDGDTLVIGDYLVRLTGIDAPETDQLCLTPDERPWECGQAAFLALQDLLSGREIRCDVSGRGDEQRTAGMCWATDALEATTINLNAEMVRLGLAVAEGADAGLYLLDEEGARRARKGLWSGQFIRPAEWRHLYSHANGAPDTRSGTDLQGNP